MSLWIAGIGTAASIGMGAYSLSQSGGGGGGINTKSIKNTLDEYLKQIGAAVEAGRANVGAAVAGMDKKIGKYTGELRNASDAETKAFWNNLGIFNDGLINSASALVETYDGDVNKALETLQSNIASLNEGYASDMGAEIERYGSVEDAINAKLVTDKDLAETKFLDRVNQNQTEYRESTFREVADTQSSIFGESDKFMQRGDAARQDYLAGAKDSEGFFKEEGAADLAKREADSRFSEAQFRSDMLNQADLLSGETKTLGDTFLDQTNSALIRQRQEVDDIRRELTAGTPTVNAEAEAARSLAFNTENAAAFGQLADTLSKAAQQTRMDLLATADPRALELSAIADENAAAMMSGRISSDVQANIARTAAMQALGGGFSGGAMQRNLEARDLGLTSLDLQQRGTAMYDAQRRLNYDTRVAGTQVNPFDVMQTSGLSTQQALATATDNAARQQQSRLASAEAGMGAINARLNAENEANRYNLEARRLGAFAASDIRRNAFTNLLDTQRQNISDIYSQQRADSLQMFNRRNNVLDTDLGTRLGLAEADRNTRIGAIQEASNQRLQTYDRLFGSNLSVADTLRGQDMTLAGQLSDNRRDANIRASGMRMAATQDIYNNMMGLSDTVFNTGMGLAGQKLSTGLSVAGDIYKTNTGGADRTYQVRTGIETNIFGGRTDAAIAGMQAMAAYEAAALQAQAGALGNAAATQANIPIANAAMRQGAANASAQMWGSALNSVSSLAGSYLGNANWNQGGRTFGGGFGSAGSAYNAAPFASSISYTKGVGYVPVAGRA